MVRIDFKRILLALFLLICIFFPGDPLQLKIIFFVLLVLLEIGTILICFKQNKHTYIFIMGLFYPLFLMLQSSIVYGDVYAAIQGAYPGLLLLLVIIIYENDLPFEKYVVILLKLLALLTIFIVVIDFIGAIDINQEGFIRNLIYQYDMGIAGKSTSYAMYYKVFFKASPLILLLIPYAFENDEKRWAVLAVVALLFSGTRANIIVGVVVFIFGFINIWSEKNHRTYNQIVKSLIVICMVLAMMPALIEVVQDMMGTAGSLSSDAIKRGQLYSFLKVFSDPLNLIFGQGFGSSFYDAGRNAYSTASEISYFDLLRKIGLISFIPFVVFLVKPFLSNIGVHLKVAYVGYLLVAVTNPLLFSSTAYVLYTYLLVS